MEQNKIINIILDNMQKFFYPEEWLEIDLKLSKSELLAMLIVDRYGEVTMSKISEKINVSMSTATGIIDRLVKKKYLERGRSESDRRVVLIKLTEKGLKTIKSIKNSINHYLDIVYESLTDEEIRVLYGIIMKVFNVFNKEKVTQSVKNREKSALKKINIE